MFKHINKLLVLLCTTSLIGCVGYDKDKASTPEVEFAGDSAKQCFIYPKDTNPQCKMTIKFSKFNQSGLELFTHILPDNNLTRESCDSDPKAGCGIAYNRTRLDNSIKDCQDKFAHNNEGTCDFVFDYTLGKSGISTDILKEINSNIVIGITGGNGTGAQANYLVLEYQIKSPITAK